jgi:hypothetical protein
MSNPSSIAQMGFFGNIWVRMHHYKKAGDHHNGHKHHFDHVTLVTQGSVLCEVEGHEPKEFKAPTFIVIKKDKKHKFTALEDDTTYFCVYALRDIDGNVTDVYSGDNSPYGHNMSRDEVEQRMAPQCISCGGCEVADALKACQSPT